MAKSLAQKYCPDCDKYLSVDDFTKNKYRHDGLTWICRECHMVYRKERREKIKETQRKSERKVEPFKGFKRLGDAVKEWEAGGEFVFPEDEEYKKALDEWVGRDPLNRLED